MPKKAYIGINNVARKVNKIYIGVDETARRVKKAYIGIGGIARPFWGYGVISKYGSYDNLLNSAKADLAGTSTSNYAIFAGGAAYTSSQGTGTDFLSVIAFDKTLTKKEPTESLTHTQQFLAATTINNYALFAGGDPDRWTTDTDLVTVYDDTLTKRADRQLKYGRNDLAGTSTSTHAIFAGGAANQPRAWVDAFNTSLTNENNVDSLNCARDALASTTLKDHAIFAGGNPVHSNYDDDVKIVNIYNTSLTQSFANNTLTSKRIGLAATTVGNYAIFAGGTNDGSTLSSIDIYDKSFSLIGNPPNLVQRRSRLAATTIGDYAIFAGGKIDNDFVSTVDIFDSSLTRIEIENCNLSNERAHLAATTIGDYAIFAGGKTGNNFVSTVDIYKLI